MILRFLAIEAPGRIESMIPVQRHGGGRDERDALVGRTEQHVEGEAGMHDSLRVTARQERKPGAGIEQAGVEEIRADSAGLQRKTAEAQYFLVDDEFEKPALKVLHGRIIL